MAKSKKSVEQRGTWDVYDAKVGEFICFELANGKSLARIALLPGMPQPSSVIRWAEENEDFALLYAKARGMQAEFLVDEMIDIADNCEDVQKAKLQIDTRKWLAEKRKPKQYGPSNMIDLSQLGKGAAKNIYVSFVNPGSST